MKIKSYSRVIALIMSGVMMSAIASTPVLAYDMYENEIIESEYALANSVSCNLNITNNTASLSSIARGDSTVISIKATQTIEKFFGFWIWNTVDGLSWEKIENGKNLDMSNQQYLSQTGTYRAKTVFVFTSSTGSTEEITVYSNEVTI